MIRQNHSIAVDEFGTTKYDLSTSESEDDADFENYKKKYKGLAVLETP